MPEELDMNEAAMLSESDPLRQEWERKIAHSTPEVQAQWRELVAEAKETRESLRDIGLPEGLFSQLLAVPTAGEMEAAAMLPEGDAVREEWEARVARTSAGAGGYMNGSASHHTAAVMGTRWRELVETSDTLRTAMREGSDAAMPESLQRRLLAIPQTRKWWQASAPVRWAGAAVAALLLYYVGEFSRNRYQAYQDRRELTEVASLVVTQHPMPPTPLVESEDEQQVTEVLAKQGMTMPPLMVEYRRGGTHLTGGGVTTFNGEKAYFTLWEWEGRKYTLYQFMPSTFHLRDNFVAHETVVSAPKMPAPPATSPSDYRIWYWSEPDHHCGWAVVSAATSADNPFVW